MKQFGISGVWFSKIKGHYEIDFYCVHFLNGHQISHGTKVKKADMLGLVDNDLVYTIAWEHTSGKWAKGSSVEKIFVDGHYELRSDGCQKHLNNLTCLLDMDTLAITTSIGLKALQLFSKSSN